MKPGPLQLLIAALFCAGALALAEWRLPVRQSIETDGLAIARSFLDARARVLRLQLEMPQLRREIERLGQSVAVLSDSLERSVTDELYITINPGTNRLLLRRGRDTLLVARVSTGRGDTLRSGRRKWVFETPRGIMTVVRKKEKPVWLKPDWAFVEAGESIPAWNSPLRRERGILGDYLLDLGGGVMIHGTPQEHLLGRSVTHGCIRVGKEELKVLYDSVPIGTRVFIY